MIRTYNDYAKYVMSKKAEAEGKDLVEVLIGIILETDFDVLADIIDEFAENNNIPEYEELKED